MDMNAAVVDTYGSPEVVRIQRRPRPHAARGDVVVDVSAASVNSGDARIRGARFPRGFGVPARIALGVRRPRRPVLGVALSGRFDYLRAGDVVEVEIAGLGRQRHEFVDA